MVIGGRWSALSVVISQTQRRTQGLSSLPTLCTRWLVCHLTVSVAQCCSWALSQWLAFTELLSCALHSLKSSSYTNSFSATTVLTNIYVSVVQMRKLRKEGLACSPRPLALGGGPGVRIKLSKKMKRKEKEKDMLLATWFLCLEICLLSIL